MAPLFEIPITSCDAYPGGSIVATEPATNVYLLTFTYPPDNRLVTPFCQAMLQALDALEFGYPPGVVITTSGIPKFYSNGLDLDHASNTDGYWTTALYPFWRRLLIYPMPTLALVNGHAFAGGIMTAMHHDYRVFNPVKGFLCVNEIEFGAHLPAAMSSIFRQKVTPAVYRSLVLEARRFAGPAALEAGIVDALGGLDEALKLVRERDLTKKGRTGVYGLMKFEMYRESLRHLGQFEADEARIRAHVEKEDERAEKGREWVEKLKRGGKAKL